MHETDPSSNPLASLLSQEAIQEALRGNLGSLDEKYRAIEADGKSVFHYRPWVTESGLVLVATRILNPEDPRGVSFFVHKIDLGASIPDMQPEPVEVLGVPVLTRNNDVRLVLAAPDDPSPLLEKHGASLPDLAADPNAAWADVDADFNKWQERNSLDVSGGRAVYQGMPIQRLADVQARLGEN